MVTRAEARADDVDLASVQGLVFAVLRHRPLVDAAISRHASRGLDGIDPAVLDLLRVATAEVVANRTPAPLVVDSAVHAVRTISPKAAGFANAVLRRITDEPPRVIQLSDIGVPHFVDAAMRHVLAPEDVDGFWEASQQPAVVGLRTEDGVPGAEEVPGIPGAWLWRAGAPPDGIPIQDPASVAVTAATDARPGGSALDIAAAPGGKTQHLLDLVGDEGWVVAMDAHMRRVRDAVRRVPGATWLVGDGRAAPFRESVFDTVLVDAPCTGLGTLRRRPELRERVTPEDMTALAGVQRAILEEALRVARPGGRVVYSVCTVTPAETIDVVAGLGGRPPEGLPGLAYGDGWLMSPHLGPTDGMFVAVFDR